MVSSSQLRDPCFRRLRVFDERTTATDLICRVEQPVGTGFSIGEVTATGEEDLAQDFVNFFRNFETTFGIKNFKIYVTGESYAGRYVPYISAAMLDEKDKEYFDLSGKKRFVQCSRHRPS